MIKKLLFEPMILNSSISWGLLILRVVFGGMMMTHGFAKLMKFKEMSAGFMGGNFGLSLVIFAEVFCSAAVIFGLLHRLAVIPMIIAMGVAFFVAHGAKLVGKGNGETALLYLAVLIVLFILGPGKYSIDNWLIYRFL